YGLRPLAVRFGPDSGIVFRYQPAFPRAFTIDARSCRFENRHLTMKPMTRALTMSIKKADTSGRMMKAVGAAPSNFVTAVKFATAVGVAPRLIPLKPAEITAAK